MAFNAERWPKKPLLLGAAVLLLLVIADLRVDHRHLFWRALDPNAQAGAGTYIKLLSLNVRPNQHCLNLLADVSAIDFAIADTFRTNEGCGWDSATKLKSSHGVSISKRGSEMRCPMTLAAHIWLGELNALAVKTLGSSLKAVTHAGTYNCRRQNHNPNSSWSQHAYANAWDVLGFQLKDGSQISVLKDWGKNNAKGNFLRKANTAACQIFGVVLGPDYNAAHRDHFHLDLGFGDVCS